MQIELSLPILRRHQNQQNALRAVGPAASLRSTTESAKKLPVREVLGMFLSAGLSGGTW